MNNANIQTFDPPLTTAADALPAANLRRRFAAMVYDSFLLAAVFMAVTVVAIAISAVFGGQDLAPGDFSTRAIQGPAYRLVLLASWFGFFSWFWCFSGQTLGMQAWRIKIVNANNDALTPTLAQVSKRFAMAIVSALCLGLGYWLALRSPRRLSWPDRASGTRVVLLPKP